MTRKCALKESLSPGLGWRSKQLGLAPKNGGDTEYLPQKIIGMLLHDPFPGKGTRV